MRDLNEQIRTYYEATTTPVDINAVTVEEGTVVVGPFPDAVQRRSAMKTITPTPGPTRRWKGPRIALTAFAATAVVVAAVAAFGLTNVVGSGDDSAGQGVQTGPVTSFMGISGTYLREGPAAPTYLHLFEDGTIHTSTSTDLIVDQPETVIQTRFEGIQVYMTTDSVMCDQPDQGGTYEVHVLANNNLEFVAVGEDTCELRSFVLRGHREVASVEYAPVP